MDMTMIDVTGIEDVQEGDEVIIFGKELPVQQLAEWADTIPYEIMTVFHKGSKGFILKNRRLVNGSNKIRNHHSNSLDS